jgi:isopentenyl-diphosphate delta-isomerase
MTVQWQSAQDYSDIGVFERASQSSVVTVDTYDNEVGFMEKIDAHRAGGTLHRAFSIFIFDNCGRLLLQRRASTKYHFGDLWTNTCCGHAVPNEDLSKSAPIRLWQEMGICTELQSVGIFAYNATCPNSKLTEREIDHVYRGVTDDKPCPDPLEVGEWRWAGIDEIQKELRIKPRDFTPWFALGLAKLS